MAPLPPIWDPARGVDRLPQPFRMIDKLVAGIVEEALAICIQKEKEKRQKRAVHIDTVISPHAVLITDGRASCFTTVGVAGMAVVGTSQGELFAVTARDPLAVGKDAAHSSCVTAMDTGHIAATGTKVVASASKTHLAVHEVVIKTSELRPLVKVEFPPDPDVGDLYPAGLSLANNAGHVAVWWSNGAVAVYEVQLPKWYHTAPDVDSIDASPPDLSGGQLNLVLHFPVAVVKGLLVGNSSIGSCNVVWQQQQRPDKSGKSDRNHKPARGVYMWWMGCNKLTLSYLDTPMTPAPEPAPAATTTASPQTSKPSTPSARGATPPGGARTSADPKSRAPPAPAPGARVSASGGAGAAGGVRSQPSRGWLLPLGITSSCVSESGKMLAFGLSDGTILVWDDHFGGHTKILPRMPSAVTGLSFVNGVATRLLCTSQDGSIYIGDLAKPEDSTMTKTKLPHKTSDVYFLPNDPFAICVCPGDDQVQPALVFFNMMDHRLTAELTGKGDKQGFGRAGLPPPAVTIALPPPPPSTPAAAPGSSSITLPPIPAASPAPAPPPAAAAASSTSASSAAGSGDAAPPAAPSQPSLPGGHWPRWCFRENYLVASGPTVVSSSYRPPDDGPPPQPDEIPMESHLYLYKIDAIARMLNPEEMASTASKSLLDRMLADLDPPKRKRGSRVKMGIPDPDAPKPPPSAMRKPGELPDHAHPDGESMVDGGGRRHIKFNEADSEGLFNDVDKGKLFKKETRSGGYSDGRSKPITGGDGIVKLPPLPGSAGKLDLSSITGGGGGVPAYMQERPQSPPWHHTNPLARIHPDWEEAPVLARIMERLGSKGGGRRRRDRRLTQMAGEMKGKMAKEPGPKPNLIFQ